MGVKYRMEWTNAQDDVCVLSFIVDDDFYTGDPITIYGGPRPFVLSEFNTDNDIFKPIRPQQATIEVLASINGVDIEDFIIESDDREMQVRFDFGAFTGYWFGVLSQEDMQETWIAQNHILTLRADEGFGSMRTIPLNDGAGAVLLGTYTPFQLIQYASTETVQTFFNCNVISNLFDDTMTTASTDTGIDQCTIDARTFETSPGVFEDSYTVLEKINKSWNQTIFQWQGQWWIVRVEDLFVPPTSNIRGFQNNKPVGGQRGTFNTRWMIDVGYNERVKPIMPEMLKTLNKPSKQTTINYDWEAYDQVVCNEAFKYGTQLGTTGTYPNETYRYSVVNWTPQAGTFASPVPSTALFERQVVYANTQISDEYVVLAKTSGNNTWARSCNVYVIQEDLMNLSIQYSLKQNIGTTSLDAILVVHLYGNDGTYWTLNETGDWFQSNATWTVNSRLIEVTFASGTGADWYDFELECTLPRSGYINILLFKDGTNPVDNVYFRNLNVNIDPKIQKFRRKKIIGDFDRYTISPVIKKNFDDQIWMDDAESANYKGAIFETDGITLTQGTWFRRRYNTESFTFKRQNAIANWWINRKYRTRLECNFYGLKWERSGSVLPIGMINTINFVDDAPTKTFWIANLKEIDFMACTWQANLVEIWDTTTDEDVEPTVNDVHLNDYYYE
jgi:hypothetical protein